MESISKILLTTHVVAGFISLIIFWIPIFVRKGGDIHRKVGKVYVLLMWFVVISAFLLSIENFIKGQYFSAVFLGFLTFITGRPLWSAISILKNKKNLSSSYLTINLVFNIIIGLSAIALLIFGLSIWGKAESVMMIFFSLLGLGGGWDAIKQIRSPMEKVDWYKEHLSGMIVSAIAGYTAFFAFGGRQFFSGILTDYWQILPWIAPTIIGVTIIKIMERKIDRERN